VKGGGKPALLLVALILAGCGGSAHVESQVVRGAGVAFEAPAGWKVARSARTVSASHDSQLLQVSTFPLVKSYSDALFDKVKRELDVRMQAVAKQLGGTVTGSTTVTAGGIRSHSYAVAAGKDVVEYTFVLQGKREDELLCRRPSSTGDGTCKHLLATFVP
jgi:hypothetical protein